MGWTSSSSRPNWGWVSMLDLELLLIGKPMTKDSKPELNESIRWLYLTFPWCIFNCQLTHAGIHRHHPHLLKNSRGRDSSLRPRVGDANSDRGLGPVKEDFSDAPAAEPFDWDHRGSPVVKAMEESREWQVACRAYFLRNTSILDAHKTISSDITGCIQHCWCLLFHVPSSS